MIKPQFWRTISYWKEKIFSEVLYLYQAFISLCWWQSIFLLELGPNCLPRIRWQICAVGVQSQEQAIPVSDKEVWGVTIKLTHSCCFYYPKLFRRLWRWITQSFKCRQTNERVNTIQLRKSWGKGEIVIVLSKIKKWIQYWLKWTVIQWT